MANELEPPAIRLEIVDDRTDHTPKGAGFLNVRNLRLRNHYPDGSTSAVYGYDLLDRRALDAVCVLAHRVVDGRVCVLLRSSLRPPLVMRASAAIPFPADGRCVIWELPAGLVEPDEAGEAGVRACAARELHEETGFRIAAERFSPLGAPFYLSPGVLGESLHLFSVALDDERPEPVPGDGSPVEDGAVSVFVPLDEALAACADGRVRDAKTEVALHRFRAQRGAT